MSLPRSDNEQLNHPKPEFEHYRKFNSGTGLYADWVDNADVVSNVTIAFRKNKTFRIGGADFLCDQDGTTFIAKDGGGGGGARITWTPLGPASGGEAYMTLAGIGTKPTDGVGVFQGMKPLKRVAEDATPVSGQFKIDTTNDRIYVGDVMGVGEFLTVIN